MKDYLSIYPILLNQNEVIYQLCKMVFHEALPFYKVYALTCSDKLRLRLFSRGTIARLIFTALEKNEISFTMQSGHRMTMLSHMFSIRTFLTIGKEFDLKGFRFMFQQGLKSIYSWYMGNRGEFQTAHIKAMKTLV